MLSFWIQIVTSFKPLTFIAVKILQKPHSARLSLRRDNTRSSDKRKYFWDSHHGYEHTNYDVNLVRVLHICESGKEWRWAKTRFSISIRNVHVHSFLFVSFHFVSIIYHIFFSLDLIAVSSDNDNWFHYNVKFKRKLNVKNAIIIIKHKWFSFDSRWINTYPTIRWSK